MFDEWFCFCGRFLVREHEERAEAFLQRIRSHWITCDLWDYPIQPLPEKVSPRGRG